MAFCLLFFVSWINRFPHGMIFANGDVVQYVNQEFVKRNFHYIWSNIIGEGGYSPVFLYYPFYKVLFWVSNLFNLNSSQQSILYMFFFFVGAYASCLVSLLLVGNKKFKIWSPEINLFALIYAINPYSFYAFYFIWGYSPFLFLYSVIPMLVGATLELFNEQGWHRAKRLLAVLFVVHLLATVSYANLSFFVAVNFVLIGLGFLIWIITPQYSVKQYLFKLIAFFVVELAATGWAVLPQIPALILNGDPTYGTIFNKTAWIIWQRLSFWKVFSLNPEADIYLKHHPVATALTLSLVGLGIWTLIERRGQDLLVYKGRRLAIIAMVILIALVETKGKGIVPPECAVWAFSSNPLLGSLRSYGKVLIFIPFLIVLLMFFGVYNWSKRARYCLLGMTLVLCIISSFPMFLGRLQTRDSVSLNNEETYVNAEYCSLKRIPNEYLEAAAAIKRDGLGGKILSLPYSVINSPGWCNYPAWKHVGADPTIQFFSLPVVQMNAYQAFGYSYGVEWAESNIDESEWIFKLVANLGVNYFLFHKDIRKDFILPAANLIREYELKGLLQKLYDSKVVSVYRVADEYRRPIITAEPSQLPARPVVLDYFKVNPTKYVVMLKPGKIRTNLVLREAFSHKWRVYILPTEKLQSAAEVAQKFSWWEPFFLSSLPEDSHTRYGGYGNSWSIDTQTICEKAGCFGAKPSNQVVGLIVEYWPQRYVYLLLIICALFGIVIGVALILDDMQCLKKLKNKK